MYAIRKQSLKPDLWPAISRKLIAPDLGGPQRSMSKQLSRKRLVPSRLLLVPLAFVLVFASVALFLRLQPPPVASAAEILARAQQIATNADTSPFNTFHGITIGEFQNEFGPGVVQNWREQWFQAPDHYCYNLLNTLPSGNEYRESWCSDGVKGYQYNSGFDLVMIREPGAHKLAFSEVSLNTLPGALDPEHYDITNEGTEEILGRVAYVFDMRLKPNVRIETNRVHVKAWIDRERFFFLKLLIYDASGALIATQMYQTIEIGGTIPPEVFKYTPPSDAYIVDLRTAKDQASLVAEWQKVQSKVSGPLLMGPAQKPPSYLDSGLPVYDSRKGVVAFSYGYVRPNGLLGMDTVVIQGPVASLPLDALGEGQDVQYADWAGRFYPQYIDTRNDYGTLVVDRNGMRTMIRIYFVGQRPQQAWITYRMLKPVP